MKARRRHKEDPDEYVDELSSPAGIPSHAPESLKKFNEETSTNTEYGNALKDIFTGKKPKISYKY